MVHGRRDQHKIAVGVTCHWVPGSLGPGFIESQVHCVPGSLRPRLYVFATFMHTKIATFCNFVATFMQLFWQLPPPQLFATFLPPKNATFCNSFCIFFATCFSTLKKLQKVAKQLQKGYKKVAKRVATNLQKVANKSCIKVANTENPGRNEPGTQ